LQELNNRFNEQAIELLKLSTTLDPRNSYKLFNIEDICLLVDKFYPEDFSNQEKNHLRFQLQHYELDVPNHTKLKNISLIADLCQGLVETEKSIIYPLIDRLIRLILTLPVSTVTTEQAFSTMKIVKIRLHNRMKDDFLANYLANKYNILIYLIVFENNNNNSGMNLHLVFSWVLLVAGCKMLKFKR
jgi:hypothetical protein